ncbi:MAG: heme ABC exporter ATP-binding protein CcmA [Candidatus Tectomicrobia bacterium]|nr:heme ABC exporter ATP-binding protein CcmA [Candidatus Tectomicrobia bacterium]
MNSPPQDETPNEGRREASPAPEGSLSPDARLSARGLTRKFGPLVAVEGVDLSLPAGGFLSVFGPNGAGKTTLLRMLALLVRPSAGRIWVDGEEATRGPMRDALRSRMSLLSHQPLLYSHLSPLENLRFYGKLYGVPRLRERAEEVLEAVGLADRARDPVRGFSRGMLQRAAVGRVLLHNPDILFLDEPFTGLDRSGARMLTEVLVRLREQGRTLVLTTHDLERGLDLCDTAMILRRGRVRCAARRSEIDAATFAEVYEFHTEGRS